MFEARYICLSKAGIVKGNNCMSFGKEDIDVCTEHCVRRTAIINSPEVAKERAGFVVKGYQHLLHHLLHLVAPSSCLDVT